MANRGLVWFKNDLRIDDNESLYKASLECSELICLYCLDPRTFRKLEYGFLKTSEIRYQYLKATVQNLRKNLKSIGSDLLIVTGAPEDIIPELIKSYKITHIYAEQEYASEELAIINRLKNSTGDCIEFKFYWGKTLYHIEDIPFEIENIPWTSKAFRIPVSKQSKVRNLFPIPNGLKNPENIGESSFPKKEDLGIENLNNSSEEPLLNGGEESARDRVNYYLFESELLTGYRWTRNRSLGMDFSSKFSPFLALGSLSPRYLYHEIKKYELKVKKNQSTWWMVFELVWRDYFTFKSMRVGNKLFKTEGFKNKQLKFENNKDLFDRWCKGTTGIPFIDAHMRKLNKTGFMSNRGRVNCASFLVHDYSIDWTWGAAYFESKLIDYDVSSNWMNWHVQAFEIYYTNPIHQSLKYKSAEFIQTWVRELSEVNSNLIYIPWLIENPDSNVSKYPHPVEIFSKWGRSINRILNSISSNIA